MGDFLPVIRTNRLNKAFIFAKEINVKHQVLQTLHDRKEHRCIPILLSERYFSSSYESSELVLTNVHNTDNLEDLSEVFSGYVSASYNWR